MRLIQLNLVRYGNFTDVSLDLSAGKSNFYVIFGPNEAGKTTALTAISDLLFGIPSKSPYNFLHNYSDMRIGAIIESGGKSLEMFRRKGNRDTLLDSNNLPISGGEDFLRTYLAGSDRSFFERMFSLDHVRLEAGGREILEAKDDVGQQLFSAGSGITGLREHIREFSNEADGLWGARRAQRRKYYISEGKLQEAQRMLREQTLTASKWQEIKRSYQEAEEVCTEIDKSIRKSTEEYNRLNRIRRVFRSVREKQRIDNQLTELGNVIKLPENAKKIIDEVERKDMEMQASIAILQKQLEKVEEDLKDFTFDKMLIRRNEDIQQLHERRIEIRSEKADLPKREAERQVAERKLHDYANELGWKDLDTDKLIKRIPPRSKVNIVHSLLNKRGGLETEIRNHAGRLQELQEAYEILKEQLGKITKPVKVSKLVIAIEAVREQGDITGRVHNEEKLLEDVQRRVNRLLNRLKPSVSEKEVLMVERAPVRAEVQAYSEREEEWERSLREKKREIESIQQERDAKSATLECMEQDKQVVTLEKVNQARGRRDALWALIKIKYVGGKSIPKKQVKGFEEESKDLPNAFESTVVCADRLADQRFSHAEDAARITEIHREVGDLETRLEQKRENESRLVKEGNKLKIEWTSMWDATSFNPLPSKVMLEWFDVRDEILETVGERERIESSLEMARDAQNNAKEQLLSEMEALGIDVTKLQGNSLSAIIKHAENERQRQEDNAHKEGELTKNTQTKKEEITRQKRSFEQANMACDDWREEWESALVEIGLSKDTSLNAIGLQIDIIDRMRETVQNIQSLQHDRIDKINRDAANFEKDAKELIGELAEDLSGRAADDAMLELKERLDEAGRLQKLHQNATEGKESLTGQIRELKEQQQERAASISHLMEAVGTKDKEDLKRAVKRSDEYRAAEHERKEIIDTLRQDGDGKSIEEIEKECESVTLDEIVAEETSVQAVLEDLREQQTIATEERSRAREAFQSIGGDDVAARAASRREEAHAEMRKIAKQYIQVKTSEILLQWAIERYRQEKQGPLLKRAGKMFNIITRGSFDTLKVDFDEHDELQLRGVRPNNDIISVSGMSTGASDQLYLVLRIAAIEEYLERTEALPFIADDLFINFDDERAAAGFNLLEVLSQKTQIIFFTHHQHLVEIAQQTLGDSINLVRLGDALEEKRN